MLKQNITRMFGEEGRVWIDNLPLVINSLKAYWGLKQISPVENMTFNYVAKAMTDTDQPVVLKISYDEKSIFHEIQALTYFDGHGCIHLLSHHPLYQSILLQQAIPGETLNSFYPLQMEYVMDSYVDTMKKLHHKHLPKDNHYDHIRDWLKAIDKLSCSLDLIKKAISLKNELLATMTNEIFLHGDLHHDNILKNNDHWLAIDPKGVVGDAEFEIAAFDFMHVKDLANRNDVKKIFEERIKLLAEKANLNPQRIKDWVFVRLILMAAWHIEDNSDPIWELTLAERLIH